MHGLAGHGPTRAAGLGAALLADSIGKHRLVCRARSAALFKGHATHRSEDLIGEFCSAAGSVSSMT
jgi:hypothetical protein